MLVRWQRPRSQFEPGAQERHELKRAVGISRQSLRVRSIKPAGGNDRRLGRKNWRKVWSSRFVVQCHLRFGLIDMDWQTDYIAACFYALLMETQPRVNVSSGSPSLCGKALSHLRDAIVEAGPGLPSGWILEGDPDLAPLRQRKRWRVIKALLSRGTPATNGGAPLAPGSLRHVPGPRSLDRYPSAPWPCAWRRIAAWAVAAAAAAVGAASLIASTTMVWSWPLVLLAVLCFARALVVNQERSCLAKLSSRFAANSKGAVHLTQRP